MKKPIQIAVIGCGRIAGHHGRSISKVDGVELAAVCDLNAERSGAFAQEFGVPHFLNYHEMFQKIPSINTVAIVTPSGMHFEHATEIMKLYRKNVIIEKPTFMKPSQESSAFELAETLGLSIFPVFQNRYNHAVARVRKALAEDELGAIRLVSVRVRWCRPQRYYDLAPWRGTFSQDGGALTNQGIHHVDLMRHLGGEVLRVNSSMKTLGADIEVEDTAVGTAVFASGALGVLEVTTAARPQDYEASISLVCEKGLAQIGGIAVNELQAFTPDPTACEVNSEDFSGNVYGNGHREMYQDISNFFHEGKSYPVSKNDCLNTIKLLHAFYCADEQGDWVGVDGRGESERLGKANEELANLYRTPFVEGKVYG